jgi:UDP:flavonoid glycosyltransferase YjiC (YdhE family)
VARVVVASAAYLGDFAPYIEPARRLAQRGHDVTFLAPAGFHHLLVDEPVTIAPYALDFSAAALHADPEHIRLMRHPFRNGVRMAKYFMDKGMLDDPAGSRASLLDALRGADAAVVHPTFATALQPVADHLGVPTVVGHLFPMMIPTR